jgi:hypothetical protein
MLNDDSTQNSELDLKVTADSESLDSSQTSQGTEGENEDSQLNLEEGQSKVDKLSTAETQGNKQADHWLAEVRSGRKQLEDAPDWVQKKILPDLEGSTSDPKELVRQVLEEERQDAQFKDLQATIPELTSTQANELKERYKLLRPAGKYAALKASLDAMGINSQLQEAEQRGIAKGKVSFPSSGQPSVKNSESTIAGVPVSVIKSNAAFDKFIKSAGRS